MELIDEVSDADELRPWKLGQEIGRGATGVVYAATDVETGEKRAIKLILPAGHPATGEEAHMLREIDTCVTLRHPNMVRGYAGGGWAVDISSSWNCAMVAASSQRSPGMGHCQQNRRRQYFLTCSRNLSTHIPCERAR